MSLTPAADRGPRTAAPTPPQDRTEGGTQQERQDASPRADCVLCGEVTEHPASRPGALLCPVCEWQEAQRSACSG
ncbi:hypothetical protein ACFV3R_28015 [Streptomyces sp. NPDC059740]|uniref:hypothetical protein n=1 Tax=Streptomyces sp. NPDC059740 TaxID=3346926 RepID=UPI00364E7EA8